MNDTIRTLTLKEALPEVAHKLQTDFVDWKATGPYCPGKAGYYTFLLEKNGQKKIVHFHDRNFSVLEETYRVQNG